MMADNPRCARCRGQMWFEDDLMAGPLYACLLCGSVRYVDPLDPAVALAERTHAGRMDRRTGAGRIAPLAG